MFVKASTIMARLKRPFLLSPSGQKHVELVALLSAAGEEGVAGLLSVAVQLGLESIL
jgi:hypothetical protein